MAKSKTHTKTPNRERPNGKAWSKAHGADSKPVSAATQERRARHQHKLDMIIRREPGSPTTMPEINWGWFENIMTSRWPKTRKLLNIDAHFVQTRGKRRDDDGVPLVVEINPEAKPPSGSKPSRKSVAKANAAARRDGRR